ncbi:C45 family autoproteolytic acyltransferase/hydolase [Leptospira interrogans]|uniref:C45 family autoproteolytic acyltransferase/hydolase n=1 Tax=Leptospira interrogans TaxID=173 RepID=UPI000A4837AB|nr:C45 family peptidase [Leptospira interrogans]
MTKRLNMPIWYIPGEVYYFGKVFGEIAAELIHQSLDEDIIARKTTNWYKYASETYDFLKIHEMRLVKDLEGLAEGAKIEIFEAIYIQYRREILKEYLKKKTLDCSLFSFHGGKTFLAQTIDLEYRYEKFGGVLKVDYKNHSVYQYTFAGLLGYTGLNSNGYAIGINMVHSNHWRIGVSPYLIIKKMLDTETYVEALKVIQQTRASSSRIITLCTRAETFNFEIIPFEIVLNKKKDYFVQTNHFTHQKFKDMEMITRFGKFNSVSRQNRLIELISTLPPKDINRVHEIISDKEGGLNSICCEGTGNADNVKTVAAVCYDIEALSFYALKGLPNENFFEEFKFG